MAWWQAIILGLVEGLTEYLPVSSTGHLLVVQAMLGIGSASPQAKEAADAYAICIQAGAILAVLGLYYGRVRQATIGWLGKTHLIKTQDDAGFALGRNILVAFLPAAVIGLLFDKLIESYLFGMWPIVIAWGVGGVAILVVAWRRKGKQRDREGLELDAMTWRMALLIGLIQCLAMWPGTSRSLVTIVGGVLVGLSLATAVEFSFLLGVVTLLAATAYKAIHAGPVMLDAYGWGPMIVGSFAAWLSAVLAIRWMVAYLKKHGLAVFGYYRIAIAIIVATLLLTGTLITAQAIP